MRKQLAAVVAGIGMILASGGCSGGSEKDGNLALIKTTQPPPIELRERPDHESIAYKVREEVKKIDEIYDVAVIEGKKEIIVVYKVRHLNRFRMNKIEKQLTDKLKSEYPDDSFLISSDYKIFLEAVRLQDDIQHKNMTNKQINKRFNKIMKLQDEKT